MKNKILALLMVAMLFPARVFADVIYLKGGREISGKIVKESKYSMKVLVGEVLQTIYYEEVEKVIRDEDISKERREKRKDAAEKRELIFELLKANKARSNMQIIFNQIIEQAPEETRENLRRVLIPDDVIEQLIPVYSKYYTAEELQDLIDFYSSPTGQKHLVNTPKLLEESMQVAVDYFKDKVGAQ